MPKGEAVVSSMSINDVTAMRGAILNRNVVLRNAANTPVTVADPSAVGRSGFEGALNNALQKTESANPIVSGNEAGRASPIGTAQQGSFVSTFQGQLQKINAINARAGALSVAYERGEEVDIAKVMLARQESSIAFEATLQVRNKLLSAYKDIMSMPV